jgi:4-hydroxy-4-methyl-2-oxoglutarate aldolase
MIEDPPLIRRKATVRRPSTAQVAAFRGIPTGFVADAMGGRGAMTYTIKPVVATQHLLCGVALPVECGPADNLALAMALPHIQPGDVIVAATDGFMATAVTGDLVLGMIRNLGGVGFVTDGAVRDIPGIADMGLPCFAAGVTPNSPVRNGPGAINLSIVCGGVHVDAGDIIIGDLDGIVVVPFDMIDQTIQRLEKVKAAEAALLPKIQGGLGIPDFVKDLEKRTKTILIS